MDSLKPLIIRVFISIESSSKSVKNTFDQINTKLSIVNKKTYDYCLFLGEYLHHHLAILALLKVDKDTKNVAETTVNKLNKEVKALEALEGVAFVNHQRTFKSKIKDLETFIKDCKKEFVPKQQKKIIARWQQLVDSLKPRIQTFISIGPSSKSVKGTFDQINAKLSESKKETNNYFPFLRKYLKTHHLAILALLDVSTYTKNKAKTTVNDLKEEVKALEALALEGIKFVNYRNTFKGKIERLEQFIKKHINVERLPLEKNAFTIKGYLITDKDVRDKVEEMLGQNYETIKIYCGNTLYLEGNNLTFPGKNLCIFAPTWKVTKPTTISTKGDIDMAGGNVIARGTFSCGVSEKLTIDTSGGNGKDGEKEDLDEREKALAGKYLLKSRELGIKDKWKKSTTDTFIHSAKAIATYTAQLEETYQATGKPAQEPGILEWEKFEKGYLQKWEDPTIIKEKGKRGKTYQRKYTLELACPLSIKLRPDGKGAEVDNQAQVEECKNDEEEKANIGIEQGIGAAKQAAAIAAAAKQAAAAAAKQAAAKKLAQEATLLATKKAIAKAAAKAGTPRGHVFLVELLLELMVYLTS